MGQVEHRTDASGHGFQSIRTDAELSPGKKTNETAESGKKGDDACGMKRLGPPMKTLHFRQAGHQIIGRQRFASRTILEAFHQATDIGKRPLQVEKEFIIGSGRDALLCRYFSGRRHLDPQDQLTLEFAGVYRHYHSCLMRTILIGKPTARQVEMHKVAVAALESCKAALKPGVAMGAVFDAHARTLDAAGYREHRMNATGYSLGTTFAPNWMDYPMFYHSNPEVAAPNQVYFIHLIIFDSDAGLAMTSGQTVVVTDTGCRVLSKRGTDLVVR